jgi:hypothetical protein
VKEAKGFFFPLGPKFPLIADEQAEAHPVFQKVLNQGGGNG